MNEKYYHLINFNDVSYDLSKPFKTLRGCMKNLNTNLYTSAVVFKVQDNNLKIVVEEYTL